MPALSCHHYVIVGVVHRFFYGPDTYGGQEVSVLEMDGAFDKLEEVPTSPPLYSPRALTFPASTRMRLGSRDDCSVRTAAESELTTGGWLCS